MSVPERALNGVSRLYVDANIIVYFIEGQAHEPEQQKARTALQYCYEHGIEPHTSELSIAECLRGPYSREQRDILDVYKSFFAHTGSLTLLPIDAALLELAAHCGATCNIRLADAIHIASALAADCGAFLTNDKRIRAPSALRIIQLADV